MTTTSLKELERRRAWLWRTAASRRLKNEAGALEFINELGFVLLMSLKGADLPSVQAACANSWDWWEWKQTLPEKRACAYTHWLRNRGTFISWEWLPKFLALCRRDRSYEEEYQLGLLGRPEKRILDLLTERGPLMTRELRLAYAPPSKRATRELKQRLVLLQGQGWILPCGGDTEGWSHHRWDLVERWVPARLLAAAGRLSRERAQEQLAQRLVETTLFSTPAEIAWTFGWTKTETAAAVAALLARKTLGTGQIEGIEGEVLLAKSGAREGMIPKTECRSR